jgi:predicted RNA-binding protein YlqC (UPF0109 family)
MNDPILDLIKAIISALVDSPDRVDYFVHELDDKVVYYVTPLSTELGQVIGQKGMLANSIRNVVKCASRKHGGKYVYIDVINKDEKPF